jgi:uncharacterized membrane protein
MHFEEIAATAIDVLVPFIELAGALIIVLGVLRTFLRHARASFTLDPQHVAKLRSQLVQSLVMGLEYQVAADVLRTAHAPTWTDIGKLAALIAIRSVLNYLLEREAQHLCSDEDLARLGQGAPNPKPSTDQTKA